MSCTLLFSCNRKSFNNLNNFYNSSIFMYVNVLFCRINLNNILCNLLHCKYMYFPAACMLNPNGPLLAYIIISFYHKNKNHGIRKLLFPYDHDSTPNIYSLCLYFPPALHGFHKRYFICIFQVSSHRYSVGNPGNHDTCRL